MLKRVLHAANQVVVHEETHTGKELVIENTVNAPAEVRVRGDSWQGKTTGAQLLSFNSNMDVGANNTFSENKNYFFSSVISVKEGDVFYFSCVDYSCLISGLARTMQSENEPAVGVSYERTNLAKDGVIVIKPGMNYLTITLGASGVSVDRVKELCMLNAGDSQLPWEPYTGGAQSPSPEYPQDIISVSGILKSTNNSLGGRDKLRESLITIPELRAIPGTDVRDELVVYEDGTGKIVRRVGKRVYDGTETVNLTGYQKTYIIAQSDADYNAIVASTHFAYNSANFADSSTFISISSYSKSVVFSVPDFSDEKKNPEILKSFLKEQYDNGTPVIVFYVLATPTEELLTADQVQGILRTHQYHTEICWEGLDEHLEPEVEVKCKVMGR